MRKPLIKDWYNYTSEAQDESNYTGDFLHESIYETNDATYFISFYSNKVYRLIKTTDMICYANTTDLSLAADRGDFERISPDFEAWMKSEIHHVYKNNPF